MPFVTDPGGLDEGALAPKSGKKSAMTVRVCALITEIWGHPTGYVTPYSHLTDDIGADSLNEIELYRAFEVEFGFHFLRLAADQIGARTVGDLIEIIEAHAK